MRKYPPAFNGLVCSTVVRGGADFKHGRGQHTFYTVYSEMFLQVVRDYNGLPDMRTLKAHEIRFLYNGLRAELKETTKPRGR